VRSFVFVVLLLVASLFVVTTARAQSVASICADAKGISAAERVRRAAAQGFVVTPAQADQLFRANCGPVSPAHRRFRKK
jgi:hypothetical protein